MSSSAINAVLGNLIGAANGIAFVALLAALLLPLYYRKGAITGSSLTLLVCTQLTYFSIAMFSLGESSGMGRANPALISTLYLVGAILFVFFFYAHDRNITIAQLKDSISGHQSATSALSTQSELLLSYLNALSNPILVVNAEGAVVFTNTAFMRAFMPEQDWGSGASLRVGDLPTPVQSLIARCSFQEVAALGNAVTRSLSLPNRGRNGQVFHVSAFPLHVRAGLASLVLYSLHDITPEMQMFDALARERDACSLETRNASLTHEFSNILAGIGGIAQLLAGDSSASQAISQYMIQTSELVKRGDTLLQELAAGALPLNEGEAIDLGSMMEASKEELESVLPDGIKLRLTVSPDVKMTVVGEPQALLASIIALVANAGEASLPGGTVAVTVSLAQADGKAMLKVSITDSGRGIPHEDRERVFGPFFTTKEGHRGMGLPIARSIANRHNGDLRLERSDELGTEFVLYLPLTQR